MSEDNKRIVEIDGVKIEVDLRKAKRVDSFQVGDNVKILEKKYNDDYWNDSLFPYAPYYYTRDFYGTIKSFEYRKSKSFRNL